MRGLQEQAMTPSSRMRIPPTKHGKTRTPEYNSWANMIARCCNPKQDNYHRYGGRGITICKRWRMSFPKFLADMGPKPSREHSIERRNNDKGYYPRNCCWALPNQQNSNRRTNHFLSHEGRTLTITQWAEELGMSLTQLKCRIYNGWPVELALTLPSLLHKGSWKKYAGERSNEQP